MRHDSKKVLVLDPDGLSQKLELWVMDLMVRSVRVRDLKSNTNSGERPRLKALGHLSVLMGPWN